MKTYKYKMRDQSNVIRLGNLLDDMWQVHVYFHKWQDHRYKAGLPYAHWYAMNKHLAELKATTHPHWNALPSQAMQAELKRIDAAYQRFFKGLGGKPKIKKRHKFKSITFTQAGWKIAENRITVTLRTWEAGRWKRAPVPYTFFKHRAWRGTLKTVTLKRDACNDYWICITTDFVETEALHATGESVGADFGMKDRVFDTEHRRKDTIATIPETVLEHTAVPQQKTFAQSERFWGLVAVCPSPRTGASTYCQSTQRLAVEPRRRFVQAF